MISMHIPKDFELEFLRESNLIEGVDDPKADAQALVAWNYLLDQKEMSLGVLLKLHKILMTGQPLRPDERGYFRKVDVFVGMKKMLPPHLIHAFLRSWLERMNKGDGSDWKLLHIEYENFHPFVDGNGRTGRMLMNWYRMHHGMPILTIYAKERHKYYDWFK